MTGKEDFMNEAVKYLALIICIVGGILFLVLRAPGQSDVKAMAFAMFWVGLLALLLGK
jgi:hypothetical protein